MSFKRNGAVAIRLGKTDIFIILVALLISAAVNLLAGFGVLSSPYVGLGLLIAAAGALAAQLRKQRLSRPGKQKDKPAAPPDDSAHAGGPALTAVWFVILLGWAASLAYAVFTRYLTH
jgi:hypothetical protein